MQTELDTRSREEQRFTHLVLGQPRPAARGVGRGRSKRKVAIELHPEIEHEVGLREKWRGRQATPQTLEHFELHRDGALARLYQSGAIDADQLVAATEIAAVAERIGGDVNVRTASFETRINTSWRSEPVFIEGLMRVRHEVAYTEWRGRIAKLGQVGAVLDMLVGDPVGYSVAARRHRISPPRARKLLIDAIELWRAILPQVCREIDVASVAAAHAGLI